MNTKGKERTGFTLEPTAILALVLALAALLLALVPLARAQQNAAPQSVEFEPAALDKARTALCLKASHAPLADLESDLNHLAVLSETCRAEFGGKACGLPEKPLTSDKLEERYTYYVKQPVQTHFSGHQVKVDRHSWESPNASDSR